MRKNSRLYLLSSLLSFSLLNQVNSASIPGLSFQSTSTTRLSLLSDESCPNSPPSCDGSYNPPLDSEESCCYNGAIDNSGKQAGLAVATQFWDTNPVRGEWNATGIHGLWLDYCEGSYPTYCNIGIPHYSGSQISSIISKADPELKHQMDLYFKDYRGHDENLWAHEQQKHMTCYPTLRAKCQSPDEKNDLTNEETALVGYFRAIVERFHATPTYDWLVSEGIEPSLTDTYTRDEIEKVLSEKHGGQVYLGCRGGQLNEFWYAYHLQGSVIGGKYLPVDIPTRSTCPLSGIRWTPKT